MATRPPASGSFTVMHVRGIPIRVHWTLLLFIPYLAFVLSAQFAMIERLAGMQHVRLHVPPLVWGAVLAVGLFASIAIHELAHTFVASRYGGKVRAIELMLLGGVSQVTRMPRRPLHEGLTAVVGPATSLALGLALLLVDRAIGEVSDDVALGLFYLAWMNVALGVFNLLPAFPMDGGRILRATLASVVGRDRATAIAAAVGRAFAIGIGLLALWAANWLLILVAAFVFVGAGVEARQERVKRVLAELRVGDLVPALRRSPVTIDSSATLATALARMHELGSVDLVAVDADGAPVSVIEARAIAFVPEAERAVLRVGEFLRARPPRHVLVPWDATGDATVEAAVETGADHVVVVDPRRPAGAQIVGTSTIAEIELAAQHQLAEPPHRSPARPARAT